MLVKITFLFLFLFELSSGIYAHQNKGKGSFNLKTCFGGISSGIISKYDHLEDSLAFTNSSADSILHVISFSISLSCNGNVINYFANKAGNYLTAEMKAAIRELHPGCTITYQAIKAEMKTKDIYGKNIVMDMGFLKLTFED